MSTLLGTASPESVLPRTGRLYFDGRIGGSMHIDIIEKFDAQYPGRATIGWKWRDDQGTFYGTYVSFPAEEYMHWAVQKEGLGKYLWHVWRRQYPNKFILYDGTEVPELRRL